MLHTTAVHYDRGFELNGFAWVTNCWELSLPIDVSGLTTWLIEIKRRWPDVKFITQGEFGLIWRQHYKTNDFNYRFEVHKPSLSVSFLRTIINTHNIK